MNRKYSVIRKFIRFLQLQEDLSSENEEQQVWEAIASRVRDVDLQLQRRRNFHKLIMVGSAAVVLLAFGLGFYFQMNEGDIKDVALNLVENTTPAHEITLVTSSLGVFSLKKGEQVTYASDGSIKVGEKKVEADKIEQNKDRLEYNQIIVPNGQHTNLVLADGSSLNINAGTRVVFPRQFDKKKREIFVDGEIFIDVKHADGIPFIVKTGNFEIEVLGTAFNVNAYSEMNKAEVVLVRGSVNVKDAGNNRMQLSPNQLVTIRGGSLGEKQAVNAVNYIAWTQGLLILDAKPLGAVLKKLERYYGTNIFFNTAVESLPICGTLDMNHPLIEILRRLSVTAPIVYEGTPDTGYIIKERK